MRTCIVCGCTDELACDGGCHWTRKIGRDKGLCSLCPEPVDGKELTKYQRASRKKYAARIRARRSVVTWFIRCLNKAIASYEGVRHASRSYEEALRRSE